MSAQYLLANPTIVFLVLRELVDGSVAHGSRYPQVVRFTGYHLRALRRAALVCTDFARIVDILCIDIYNGDTPPPPARLAYLSLCATRCEPAFVAPPPPPGGETTIGERIDALYAAQATYHARHVQWLAVVALFESEYTQYTGRVYLNLTDKVFAAHKRHKPLRARSHEHHEGLLLCDKWALELLLNNDHVRARVRVELSGTAGVPVGEFVAEKRRQRERRGGTEFCHAGLVIAS